MLLDSNTCQLVLIDFQEKLMPVVFEADHLLANVVVLAKVAKRFRVPIWGTEQMPDKLGPLSPQVASMCSSVLVKNHFSACPEGLIDLLKEQANLKQGGNARSLPKHLQKKQAQKPTRDVVVIAGVEAHVCLLQTALDLIEHEIEVWVVTDACGSRTEKNRDAAFDRLASCGAELVTTEMVVFEWLRRADHEYFKEVHNLVK